MKVFAYPKECVALLEKFDQMQARDHQNLQLVQGVIENVRARGDAALAEYSRKFDAFELSAENVKVRSDVCEMAWHSLRPELAAALQYAREGIQAFHEQQARKGFVINRNGAELEQRIRPLRRVGAYVPGGMACYPSTMLMNIIPAQVAGVPEIVVATPPVKQDPETFVPFAVAHMLGVSDSIYQIGGAQAIAAMAYGTAMIPKVDKVVGPGNEFVALAKKLLYGVIDIDSVAGNSELMIIADCSARADYIAADLLAQAEHTGGETVALIGIGNFDFEAVASELERQIAGAPREHQARKSLSLGGIFIQVENAEQATELANLKAPEHMEVMAENARAIADQVDNAGAIFIGPYTPEPIGDYVAGPNHVLPTGGTARFFSPLGVDAFLKASNVLTFSEEAFRAAAPHVIALAECEGLFAHANAIKIRQ